MKKITLLLATLTFIFFTTTHVNAQLGVTGGLTASDLADIIAGEGVSITNVVLTAPANASGSFTNGSTAGITINEGVLMTTGTIFDAPGPNSAGDTWIDNGGAGDADLTAASGFTTYNACVLEFDFVPSANQLTLDYVFASEEYNEWVCTQFNDVFAFFVSGPNPNGPDYVNKNIALVPGKNIPVTINNINNGLPGSNSTGNCGDLTNSAYYIDNTGATYDLEYDGFTTVLEASLELVPCATYQFKFAIADAGDAAWDAGVFIQAASFMTNNIVSSATNSPEGCPGGEIMFSSTLANVTGYTININVLGSSTASPSDYEPFLLDYLLPAGQQSLTVPIVSIADIYAEGNESIDFEFVYDAGCDPTLDNGSILIIDGPITCQDYELTLDGDGYGSITPDDVLTGDLGALCPSMSYVLSEENFVCYDEGPNMVLVTATTASGNMSECVSTVTVVVPPDIISVDLGDACRPVYLGYEPFECTDITAMASGGTPPYAYAWSNGETTQTITVCPEVTTVYDVTVTDVNGCVQVSESAEVEVIDVRCGQNGDKVLVCHIPPGEPENMHTICIAFEAVEAHLAHGCYLGECGDIPCDGIDGIQPIEMRGDRSVTKPVAYPNPTSGAISLYGIELIEFTKIEVLDMQGVPVGFVERSEVISSYGTLDFTAELPEGAYLIKVMTDAEIVHVVRFVKIR